jgi:hypothetical protein
MSAWLKCSLDPIQGADKRNEQYWDQVGKTYNETTPTGRSRNQKQVKDRWHRINKLADLFHSAYLKSQALNTSGFNEEMWVAEAHKWYERDTGLPRFQLMDVWYSVRSEPKWQTYNQSLKSTRKRKDSNGEEGGEEEENMTSNEKSRPPGQKAAKRALHESKGKQTSDDVGDDFQLLKAAEASRMKLLEMQEKLAMDRLESARISRAAAREQKEANKLSCLAAKEHKKAKDLEITVKMMETYNCLLCKDVSTMNNDEKAEHAAMLKHLKKTLYPGV